MQIEMLVRARADKQPDGQTDRQTERQSSSTPKGLKGIFSQRETTTH